MKHFVSVILVFVFMVMLTACQSPTDNSIDQVNKTEESSETVTFNIEDVNINSEEYYTCFNENFVSCTPVSCSFDGEFIEGQGRVQIIKEIKGLKDGKCEVYEAYGMYETRPEFENKSMNCLYPQYFSGNSSYETVEECSGDLADLMQL